MSGGRLRRWWRRRHRRLEARPSTADVDLERFFTNCEQARGRFEEIVGAVALPRQILVVHGAGAVGKTSLLRMFRLTAHRRGLPVALVGAEEAPSAIDLLERWAADLRSDRAPLPSFESGLGRYRELQAKVDTEARRAGQAQADAAEQLAVAVAKSAVKVAWSAVPIAGPLLEAAGGEAAEAVLNLLRAVLSRADLDFFLDPTGRLSDDFLGDLTDVADRRRIVLMLDTVETVTALRGWLCGVVQRLPADVLLVLAGRSLPDWDDTWPGWMGRAELLELTEMSDADVERLVRRYYELFGRGEPDGGQVAEVVGFARGLPLAATTAVRLWINYQVGDLQPVGPGAVADMADRLLDGVPAELRPAFEAAAVLRYFNADSLASLLETADARSLYDELRRWPFTRLRRDGLAVHDSMRQVMGDALRARSPERFRTLNEAAQTFYANLLARARGEEKERLRLEMLYHAMRADEAAGVAAFQLEAERLVRYHLVGELRALVNDANTWPLAEEGSRLWRGYYTARLDQLTDRPLEVEAAYREIAGNDAADSRLRAYALCDLAAILATLDRLAEPGGEQRAAETVRRSLAAERQLDGKLASNHVTLMNISNTRAAWFESERHLADLRAYAESVRDGYRLVEADLLLSAIHGLAGDWRRYGEARARCLTGLQQLGDPPALRMQVMYFVWPLVFAGRLREAQQSSEVAYELAIRLEERELLITVVESIALAAGMQEDYPSAAKWFAEAMNYYENVHEGAGGARADRYIRATLSFRGLVALREGRLDDAAADLARALEIKRAMGDRIGTPELYVWRGQLHEVHRDWAAAEADYRAALDLGDVHRGYFDALAWVGLARVDAARGRHEASSTDLTEAAQRAEQRKYADVLAQVALARGRLAWSAVGSDGDVAAVVRSYRVALGQALQHNRFTLDEIVGGRAGGSPLRPVVEECRDHGSVGLRVLEELHSWWRTGRVVLDGADDAQTLQEAERTARVTEPGDGTPQTSVLERLGVALER